MTLIVDCTGALVETGLRRLRRNLATVYAREWCGVVFAITFHVWETRNPGAYRALILPETEEERKLVKKVKKFKV